jgi:hypothetical protein
LPDFLRKREPAMPEPAPAAPAPDVSAMDDDEAMRWLESLAAQQGAKPEELITSPEERIAEPPIYEVAAQSRPAGRAGQPTEREALAAEDRPGWLGQSEAASPAESPQGEVMSMEATSPITSEAPPADLGSMSEDDAMRWLEGLAAQQGAKPEELITTPSFGEQTLEAPVSEVASQQAEIESITSPAEESEEEAPAQSSLSEDDAMRWLERLALQQGARPEELVTSPTLGEPPVYEITDQETEPPYEAGQPTEPAPEPVSAPVEELPDWLRQTQAPATTAEVEQPTAGLPPTLAAALEETEAPPVTFAAPAVEEKPAPTPEPKPQEEQPEEDRDSRLARLSERLATSRRAREAEIEARFASQRAGQEAARLEVQRKMEQKQAQMAAPPTARPSTGRLGTGPLGAQPGTGRLGTPEPEATPEPIPPTAETQAALPPEPTQPVETPAPTAAVPQPAPRPRTQAIVSARAQSGSDQSPFADETPENVLATARQHLGDDDHERAAEGLSYLISIGSGVDEVIATLERYSSRNQMSPLLLSVLGDAYMQNNHLQKALDTYRQALAQL